MRKHDTSTITSNGWLRTGLVILALILCFATEVYSQGNLSQDTIERTPAKEECNCKASLPLEIGVTSIVWGVPSYWSWRVVFDRDSSAINPTTLFIGPSLFLLMLTLGPIAELTSGCEASWWHTLWIGLGSSILAVIAYMPYGFSHPLNPYKFNLPEYLVTGALPAVASSIIFNLFLEPSPDKDKAFFVFPSFGSENSASLNFMYKF